MYKYALLIYIRHLDWRISWRNLIKNQSIFPLVFFKILVSFCHIFRRNVMLVDVSAIKLPIVNQVRKVKQDGYIKLSRPIQAAAWYIGQSQRAYWMKICFKYCQLIQDCLSGGLSLLCNWSMFLWPLIVAYLYIYRLHAIWDLITETATHTDKLKLKNNTEGRNNHR